MTTSRSHVTREEETEDTESYSMEVASPAEMFSSVSCMKESPDSDASVKTTTVSNKLSSFYRHPSGEISPEITEYSRKKRVLPNHLVTAPFGQNYSISLGSLKKIGGELRGAGIKQQRG